MPLEPQTLISLGVGGILALILLYWKRVDDLAHAKTLASIIARMDNQTEKVLDVITANTAALVALQNQRAPKRLSRGSGKTRRR